MSVTICVGIQRHWGGIIKSWHGWGWQGPLEVILPNLSPQVGSLASPASWTSWSLQTRLSATFTSPNDVAFLYLWQWGPAQHISKLGPQSLWSESFHRCSPHTSWIAFTMPFCSSSSYLGNFSSMRNRAYDFQPFLEIFIHLFFLKVACDGYVLQCPLYFLLQAAGQEPFSVGWQPVRLHKVCAFPLQHASSLFKS